jgi:Flp pilus assembly protein TadD
VMVSNFKSAIAAACFLLPGLVGCTGSTSSGRTEPGAVIRPGSGASLLQQVRSAGQMGDELDVQPLRDPRVEDLRASATQAEARGDYAGAGKLLAQAAVLTPDDPDLLQWQAELALVTRDWSQAEQLATRSFDKGPKLGGLCRRNWTTLQLAAEARGNAAQATQAQQRVAGCTVAPPIRM